MSEDKKGISWGGLIKGLVATAAVVAGAELMFEGFIEGAITAAKSMGAAIASAFESVGTKAAEGVADATKAPVVTTKLAENIGWMATKIGGAVLAISGIKYLLSEKEDAPEQESFSAREDMKRTQALMIARMRAQGYQPAMAAAGQQR